MNSQILKAVHMLPNICYEQEISCKNFIDSKEVQHTKFTIDMAVEEIKQGKVSQKVKQRTTANNE